LVSFTKLYKDARSTEHKVKSVSPGRLDKLFVPERRPWRTRHSYCRFLQNSFEPQYVYRRKQQWTSVKLT